MISQASPCLFFQWKQLIVNAIYSPLCEVCIVPNGVKHYLRKTISRCCDGLMRDRTLKAVMHLEYPGSIRSFDSCPRPQPEISTPFRCVEELCLPNTVPISLLHEVSNPYWLISVYPAHKPFMRVCTPRLFSPGCNRVERPVILSYSGITDDTTFDKCSRAPIKCNHPAPWSETLDRTLLSTLQANHCSCWLTLPRIANKEHLTLGMAGTQHQFQAGPAGILRFIHNHMVVLAERDTLDHVGKVDHIIKSNTVFWPEKLLHPFLDGGRDSSTYKIPCEAGQVDIFQIKIINESSKVHRGWIRETHHCIVDECKRPGFRVHLHHLDICLFILFQLGLDTLDIQMPVLRHILLHNGLVLLLLILLLITIH